MGLPRLVVTGASGFLGRHLLQAVKGQARVHALARRSPSVSGAPTDRSITWWQVDIVNRAAVDAAFDGIRREGGADLLIHLASHYDFTGGRSPEYESANVVGMRHVLDAAVRLGVDTVVFSSSVAACQFPPEGQAITEQSVADGDTPYGESKRAGEDMLDKYRSSFRTITVRFAALFSDWCEYEPLFHFMESWLARARGHRMLAGCGLSAVPYLHIRDAVDFLERVVASPGRFTPGEVLIASPDGATPHLSLFEAATTAHFGQRARPMLIPAPVCRLGIRVRRLAGRAVGMAPFERPWMGRMIDRRLMVDASYTRETLGWAPRPRLAILRRMPFLVEHRKTYPGEWHRRNRAVMRYGRRHDNLRVHEMIEAHAVEICADTTDRLLGDPGSAGRSGPWHAGRQELCAQHRFLIDELMIAVRTGEKGVFFEACRELAAHQRTSGVTAGQVRTQLEALRDVCLTALDVDQPDDNWTLALHDHVSMTFQFGVDGVDEVFEDDEPSAMLQ